MGTILEDADKLLRELAEKNPHFLCCECGEFMADWQDENNICVDCADVAGINKE